MNHNIVKLESDLKFSEFNLKELEKDLFKTINRIEVLKQKLEKARIEEFQKEFNQNGLNSLNNLKGL